MAREPDYSSEDDDPEELKKEALSVEPGVQRAVWDLRWDGAKKIKNGKIDTGDPAAGPRAIPGTYTVRLTVDGTTRTVPVKIVPDPAGSLSPIRSADRSLRSRCASATTSRRLTALVDQLRSVRDQLQAQAKALDPRKSEPEIAKLIEASQQVAKKAEALEDRLHNPTAEVVYDILAMRGGTRLYSRLAPLQMWSVEADGPPTAGMTQVLEQQESELSRLKEEVQGFLTRDWRRSIQRRHASAFSS